MESLLDAGQFLLILAIAAPALWLAVMVIFVAGVGFLALAFLAAAWPLILYDIIKDKLRKDL